MSRLPRGFGRFLPPWLELNNELSQKIAVFDAMTIERGELDRDISLLRKQQADTEDCLAEDLAEDEFQGFLSGQQVMEQSYTDVENICNQQIGCIVDKLAAKYKRIVYLDIVLRKLKQSIETGIATANAQLTAAATM
ncbi:GL22937 [Drosophila persimilis]|uniref:GL22937 n=1 Tax=Drosophila persimilis TaxID=7234 RepID=B4HDN8_DROPE|nr:GL22937 [Drosophila persimilis]